MNIETIVEWIPIRATNLTTVRVTDTGYFTHKEFYVGEYKMIFDFEANKFLCVYNGLSLVKWLGEGLIKALDNGVIHHTYYD